MADDDPADCACRKPPRKSGGRYKESHEDHCPRGLSKQIPPLADLQLQEAVLEHEVKEAERLLDLEATDLAAERARLAALAGHGVLQGQIQVAKAQLEAERAQVRVLQLRLARIEQAEAEGLPAPEQAPQPTPCDLFAEWERRAEEGAAGSPLFLRRKRPAPPRKRVEREEEELEELLAGLDPGKAMLLKSVIAKKVCFTFFSPFFFGKKKKLVSFRLNTLITTKATPAPVYLHSSASNVQWHR